MIFRSEVTKLCCLKLPFSYYILIYTKLLEFKPLPYRIHYFGYTITCGFNSFYQNIFSSTFPFYGNTSQNDAQELHINIVCKGSVSAITSTEPPLGSHKNYIHYWKNRKKKCIT